MRQATIDLGKNNLNQSYKKKRHNLNLMHNCAQVTGANLNVQSDVGKKNKQL